MIDRSHRFHGYNSLSRVYKYGKTSRGPLLALKFIPNDRRRTYRAAVVVSRKVHKSAVVRGRIRRRIYEIIRLNGPQIPAAYDIVFIVFSDQVASLPAKKLSQLITDHLAAAGIITPSRAIVGAKES